MYGGMVDAPLSACTGSSAAASWMRYSGRSSGDGRVAVGAGRVGGEEGGGGDLAAREQGQRGDLAFGGERGGVVAAAGVLGAARRPAAQDEPVGAAGPALHEQGVVGVGGATGKR